MCAPVSIDQGAVVVTSIAAPNRILSALAMGASEHHTRFIVTGDTRSPKSFHLPGCSFLDLEAQRRLPFRFAGVCHEKSYTRKNIAYLVAMSEGAKFIVETDDDNFPNPEFWQPRSNWMEAGTVAGVGWKNAYSCFTKNFIYPRGFPLHLARTAEANDLQRESVKLYSCPIQQGLADKNPDVDAVYRMLFTLPFSFEKGGPIALKRGQWCPFNSQNTTTFPVAYSLLYLPTFCSFRMTDIWRSFVAQRILWGSGHHLSFHEATVWQDRNDHDLSVDFQQEVSGYLHNAEMARTLESIQLPEGEAHFSENMVICYEALIAKGWIGVGELPLLTAWLEDVETLGDRVGVAD